MIGTATAKLLHAVKSLETAREFYLEALQERYGENNAIAFMQTSESAWDAVATILNNDITDAVNRWAVTDAAQL